MVVPTLRRITMLGLSLLKYRFGPRIALPACSN